VNVSVATVRAAVHQPRRDRNDLVGEAARVDRGNRALMAAEREGVLFLREIRDSRAWFSATRPVLRYTSGYVATNVGLGAIL
jgi:hypothetical protein